MDQFLEDGSNHRTDTYGGSFDNRPRFRLEVWASRLVISFRPSVRTAISPVAFLLPHPAKRSRFSQNKLPLH